MRHAPRLLAPAAALLAACGGDPTPPADASPPPRDAAADVAADVTSPRCPAALGDAAPRTNPAPPRGPLDDALRVNHLQAKGTHNSYHLRPAQVAPPFDYAHAPLDVQLDRQGVRALEIDLHWDAECRRLRVYHLPIVDAVSSCDLFTDCLAVVRRWSDAHPAHHPLFLHLEPKDAWPEAEMEPRLAAMEREILSVFPRPLVVTPDEVRGDAPTLAEAVRTRGWPTLGATRGRVLFYIDRTDALRTAYTHGGRDLAGRLAFVDSAMGDPFAGVMVLNNPARPEVAAAVRAGFLVRVFSWTAGDPRDDAAAQAALASGGHIVSTDYPAVVPGVDRAVEIPGGTPSRCNPLAAPAGCTSEAIERLP